MNDSAAHMQSHQQIINLTHSKYQSAKNHHIKRAALRFLRVPTTASPRTLYLHTYYHIYVCIFIYIYANLLIPFVANLFS